LKGVLILDNATQETINPSDGDRNKNSTQTVEKVQPIKSRRRRSRNKTSQKVAQSVDLSPFISNINSNIYAISGLPEEFIATLFAYVSRSSHSFKENLAKLIQEEHVQSPKKKNFAVFDERSKAFHKKWTVGYGHSSVGEHAIAHVGIENISRLASAELELSNQFLSITEYSQRYQQPKRGNWYNPFQKSDHLYDKYEAFMNQAFDAYEVLLDRLMNFKINTFIHDGDVQKAHKKYEKENFEDARYVLPLAVQTSLGVTANARAWQDALRTLNTSDYSECHNVSKNIQSEISKVLPVLLCHTEPSQHEINRKKRLHQLFKDKGFYDQATIRLISSSTELLEMQKIAIGFKVAIEGYTQGQAESIVKQISYQQLVNYVQSALFELGEFDDPPEAFKQVNYQLAITLSEAAWHQLLRHNRKINFIYSRPHPSSHLTIPPYIETAGLSNVLNDINLSSINLYHEISRSDHPEYADYVVLNCSPRHVIANLSLWEMYHLINLRTSKEAQWDIKSVINKIYEELLIVHPHLIHGAKRRG
jgi:thymidylate synthase ThyX